ncbi:MAG: hypothetical protein VYE15_04735 [Myxococcota bacterium]|nr:hypothetical protein [Myxococcota bacterium]
MLRAKVSLIVVSLLGLSWAVACDVPNPPALTVLGNVAPDDSCTVKVEGGGQQAFIFEGVLDVSLGTQYIGNFMVENNFPQFESLTGFQPQNAQLDGSTVNLDKVNVALRLPVTVEGIPVLFNAAGNAVPEVQEHITDLQTGYGVTVDATLSTLTYELPIQFTIPSTGTGLALAKLIPAHVGHLFRLLPELLPTNDNVSLATVVDFSVSGVRMDGRRVTSATVSYPINICHNCLVAQVFPETTAVSPFSPPGDSEPLTEDEIMPNGVACYLGADVTVTNAVCGLKWPGPGPGDLNECARNRCLGKGNVATGAENLVCDSDGQLLITPPAPDAGGFF